MGLTDGLCSLNSLEAILANSAVKKPRSWLDTLLKLGEQVRVATEKSVTFREALFWQGEEPVIWPCTVNLIQGQTGVHKSRVAELFGSALQAPGAVKGDALGLEFRPAEGETYRLLYIDTERNISDQLPYAIQSLKIRAGYSLCQHPPNLFYTSLVTPSRAERFSALQEYLAYYRDGFDGLLVVILDVLSDCVADYNDVAASLELMDLLNVAVNEQNVTFLAVIHENPGSTAKARGHLGTEATNKASTVLQVGFMKEGGRVTKMIQLLYLKRRFGVANLVFFATFDEATRGLVQANADEAEVLVRTNTVGAPRKASQASVLKVLPELLAERPLAAGELASALAQHLDISLRTAKDHLSKLVVPGVGRTVDKLGRPCQLAKAKGPVGPSVLYQLEPIPNVQ